MKESNNRAQLRPNKANVGMSEAVALQVDRIGDRLLQLPQVCEITTLSEATHRWMRHRGEGPPMFKLGRRLVAYESDVHSWIAEQAAKDQVVAS